MTVVYSLALSALKVSFKLPISEISEIDDHKSVAKKKIANKSKLRIVFPIEILTIRLSYKLKWKESRMLVNRRADWTRELTAALQIRLITVLSLVELLHYCALIGRELHSVEIFSQRCFAIKVFLAFRWFFMTFWVTSMHGKNLL